MLQVGNTQKVERPAERRTLGLRRMDYKKESGKRLREARRGKNWTLAELSKSVKVLSVSRLGNYEQGTRSMGTEEALALATALGVKASYLLCVDGDEGEMTNQETELLRNFRALPERDRNDYSRRIEVLALAYREPVADERLPAAVRKGPPKTPTSPRRTKVKL